MRGYPKEISKVYQVGRLKGRMGRGTLLSDIRLRVKLGSIAAAFLLVWYAPASAQETTDDDDWGDDYEIAVAKLPDDYVLPPGKEHLPREVTVYVYPAEENVEEEPWPLTPRQRFRKKVFGREIVFQVLNAVDAIQTIACIENAECKKMNPIFGQDPSAGKVIAIKAIGGGFHAYDALARSGLRAPYESLSVGDDWHLLRRGALEFTPLVLRRKTQWWLQLDFNDLSVYRRALK